MRLDSPQPPRLPDAPAIYNAGLFNTFNNVLRLYFARLSAALNTLLGSGGGVYIQNPHAMLMSTADQASAGPASVNLLTFNQSAITQGVEVRNSRELWFKSSGQYLVTFTLQVSNRDNTEHVFEVWAGYDGQDYPMSNTRFDIPARKSSSQWAHITPAITGIFTVTDPDSEYLTIKWWSDSALVFLEHYPAGTAPARPEIPSVILTINFVSRLP
jgi:hypothetical protein